MAAGSAFFFLILFLLLLGLPLGFIISGIAKYWDGGPNKEKGKWFVFLGVVWIGLELLMGYSVCGGR